MILTKYTCYVLLLTSYIVLTKNTFRNMYRKLLRLSTVQTESTEQYVPVDYHWFYKTSTEGETLWKAFSKIDTDKLERAYQSFDPTIQQIISTDGGRYDVNLTLRKREPVYWSASSTEVRRCSWFYKSSNDKHFTPFEECTATLLECEYQNAFETKNWCRFMNLPNSDSIAFKGPDNIVLLSSQRWPHHDVVKRGVDDEFEIAESEPDEIDHLIFAVHGIGAVCDFRFRTIEEVVDICRKKITKLLETDECARTKRVEILPVNWHKTLHNKNSKIDENLHSITLDSMPLLRNFTNNTLVDILLYTSTIYSQDGGNDEQTSIKFSTHVPFAQIILTAVTNELNRMYDVFKQRNPKFNGTLSLLAHSLGSVIIFDLLCHQQPVELNIELEPSITEHGISWCNCSNNRINLLSSNASKQQLQCPQLLFKPSAFFAVGSPIGLFLTVRGIDKLGLEFCLPTCKNFFNIFHPCDPIAYRIEPLVNLDMEEILPSLVPHCGTKSWHTEIKGVVLRFGEKIKTAVLEYLTTQYIAFLSSNFLNIGTCDAFEVSCHLTDQRESSEPYLNDVVSNPGNLNKGRRIDYSLQGTGVDCLNEYVCAVTSHACYWESHDVIQLILNELYGIM